MTSRRSITSRSPSGVDTGAAGVVKICPYCGRPGTHEDSPCPSILHAAPPPLSPFAVREVLGLQARIIPALPLSATLLCRRGPLTADPTLLCITTSRAAYVVAHGHGWDVLVGGELAVLVVAVEHDRAGPGELAQWCACKRADPQWRLTYEVAVGLITPLEARGWSVGQVLAVLDLELVGVGTADEVPALSEQRL